jgi:hypothetical protein
MSDDEMSLNPPVEEVPTLVGGAVGMKEDGRNNLNHPTTTDGLPEAETTKKYIQLTLDGRLATASTSWIVVKRHVRANPKKGNASNKPKPAKCVRKRNRNISIKLSLPTKKPSTNEDLISVRLARKLHIEEMTKLFDSIKTK